MTSTGNLSASLSSLQHIQFVAEAQDSIVATTDRLRRALLALKKEPATVNTPAFLNLFVADMVSAL